MGKIAEYAASLKRKRNPLFRTVKKTAWELKYRLLYETDRPYNQVVMVLYILCWQQPCITGISTFSGNCRF